MGKSIVANSLRRIGLMVIRPVRFWRAFDQQNMTPWSFVGDVVVLTFILAILPLGMAFCIELVSKPQGTPVYMESRLRDWWHFFETWGSYNRHNMGTYSSPLGMSPRPFLLVILLYPITPLTLLIAALCIERKSICITGIARGAIISLYFLAFVASLLLVRHQVSNLLFWLWYAEPSKATSLDIAVRKIFFSPPHHHRGLIATLCGVWLITYWYGFVRYSLDAKRAVALTFIAVLVSLLLVGLLRHDEVWRWIDWFR